MSKLNIKNLEKISDYSIALMDEITCDIEKLSKYSSTDLGNRLDDVNKKIDLARVNGVNVELLDKQILEFRLTLFNRDTENKLERIKTHKDKYIFDISQIEKVYNELKTESSVDQKLIDDKMKNIYDELIRSKIKFMIRNIREGENNSSFTFDSIAYELEKAKNSNIYIEDIENMLYEI